MGALYEYIGEKSVRRKLNPQEAQRMYDMGLSDFQIAYRFGFSEETVASWRRQHQLPPNGKVNVERCHDCKYWRNGGSSYSGSNSVKFCHHLLETEKRRQVDTDGLCLSQVKREDL